MCSFELWRPIAELRVSVLGLYDDGRFPGRCLIAVKAHEEDFARLSNEDTSAFVCDIQAAARAIQRVTQAPRINYAILGNVEPHIHAHLIPRSADDPIPKKSPWQHPEPVRPLGQRQADDIIRAIRERLLERT